MSVVRETLVALSAPRRLVPTLLVAAALIGSQTFFTPTAAAVGIAVLMCATFILVAPAAWRALFPVHVPRHGDRRDVPPLDRMGPRILAYGLIGIAAVALTGWVVPHALGEQRTLLTARGSLLVEPALFWVGGWGLARDIDLERVLLAAEARADAAAHEAERAQLLALRSQLDPHVLFNTLNAIAEWCRLDGAVAEAAILRLSGLLRAILEGTRDAAWPLERELALVTDLFELHRVRDPERFEVAQHIDPTCLQQPVPPLLLLPLAENAMTHGPSAGHAGQVVLTVERAGADVRVTLDNPGAPGARRPGGEGLSTVERRLAHAYGGRASMGIGPSPDDAGRTRVTVLLPADATPQVMA